jgi:hypothetical protein
MRTINIIRTVRRRELGTQGRLGIALHCHSAAVLQIPASQLFRQTSVSTHWPLLRHEWHLIGSARENVFRNDILRAGWSLSMTYNPSSDAYSFTVRQQFPAICRTSRRTTIFTGQRSEPKNPISALTSCMIPILITSHLHLVFFHEVSSL